MDLSEFKKYDYYRYLSCLLVSSHLQQRFFPIYLFNNEIAKIKSIVTEPMAGHIRLQWWRDVIDEIYQGKPVKHDVQLVHALYEVVSQVGIEKELFDRLIDARESDLEFVSPDSIEALEKYSIATCSGLFELLLAAVENDEENIKQAAQYAGVSYAFTGIMRSLKFNAHHGKVMLPNDLLAQANISQDDVIAGRYLERTVPVVKAICDKSLVSLNRARVLLKGAPSDVMSVFLPLTIVDVFLNRIKKHDYDVFNPDLEHGVLRLQLKILTSKVLGSF